MVLGSPQARHPGPHRRPLPYPEATRVRPDAADEATLRALATCPRWDSVSTHLRSPDAADPRGGRVAPPAWLLQRADARRLQGAVGAPRAPLDLRRSRGRRA